MLQAIEDPEEIRIEVRVFEAALKRGCRAFEKVVGYQSGSGVMDVHWNERHRFWSAGFYPVEGSRHWCIFGAQDPALHPSLGITVEINPPLEGIGKSAGVFAADAEGETHVLHSGLIGGGHKGVSQSKFLKWYRHAPRRTVRWSDGREEALLWLGPIIDRSLPERIGGFVREVARFKEQVKTRG